MLVDLLREMPLTVVFALHPRTRSRLAAAVCSTASSAPNEFS